MMDLEVMHSAQQDMDLIDILWKQDIDLGARREVFDYNHRQKEHELRRQRELDEEKRLHLLREQETALLAQLQLDEETGEYIPRPPPSAPLRPNVAALEVTQDVGFAEESGDALSFDECLQLLAETFPVEETESSAVCLDAPAISVQSSGDNIMTSLEQTPLPLAAVSPGPMAPPPPPPQRMSLDLEQALMELLSLPELQQCLSMQMEDTLETTDYAVPVSTQVQDPNIFYPMTNHADGETTSLNICRSEFISALGGSASGLATPDNLGQMGDKAPQLDTSFGAESFGDIFYQSAILNESSGLPARHDLEGIGITAMSDIVAKPTFAPMDLYSSLSPGDTFDTGKQNLTAEPPESDSGISSNTSPNASSPAKSAYGDGSFVYSDSDMEEMDQNPGSAESDYSEMFSLNFQPADFQAAIAIPVGHPREQHEGKATARKADLDEESGYGGAPFTKDKQRRRSEVRLPRDEQRARALKIPISVDSIINLPVDDFNEVMSKHQLSEAQLALVRDIRRRGKNKVAAQNCRKRKMENIVGLEGELDSLKEEKERLQSEKGRNAAGLKEMKQQLNSLYLEVFGMLRDEKGNSYSPSDYSLQQSTEGNVFLVPRIKKTFVKSEDGHLPQM